MGQLEANMGTISAASDSVNSSLSDRRSQLEGLNGVKKNLTKLQFLMDLPARLQVGRHVTSRSEETVGPRPGSGRAADGARRSQRDSCPA